MSIDKLQLIRGDNIKIDGVCTIRQPHIRDYDNEEQYDSYLSILLTEKDSFIKSLKEILNDAVIEEIINSDVHIFDIMMLFEETREALRSALAFFICEKIELIDNLCFAVYEDDEKIKSVICNENYNKVRDAILEINCIKIPRVENLTFSSEASRERYMKLLKHRENQAKQETKKTDSNQNISNLAGAISARSYGYNLFTIWDLTIYQLYDQFKRIHYNTTMDIAGAPILMFGEGDNKFDETFWFKNI